MTKINELETIPFEYITDIDNEDISQYTNISKENLVALVSQRITEKLSILTENTYNISDVPLVIEQFYTDTSDSNTLEFANVALQNTENDAFFYLVVKRTNSDGQVYIKLNEINIIIKGLYIETGFGSGRHAVAEEGCYLVRRINGEYFYQIPLQKKAHYYTFGQSYKNILKNTVDNNTLAKKYGHFLYNNYIFNLSSPGNFSPLAVINTAQSYQIPNFETFSNYISSGIISVYIDNSSLGTYFTIPNSDGLYPENQLGNQTYRSSLNSTYLIPQSIQLLEVYYE